MAQLGLRLNVKNKALTQYRGYAFDSMAEMNGLPVGVNDSGVFSLFTGNDDNGTDIDARADLPRTDFGVSRSKRIRAFYMGCRLGGELKIKAVDDEHQETLYSVRPGKIGKQHVVKVSGGRNFNKGYYYTISIMNVGGSDFEIDFLELLLYLLSRRPGGF